MGQIHNLMEELEEDDHELDNTDEEYE